MDENREQSLNELIEGGVITKDGSWYTVVASGEKLHGKNAIIEHLENKPEVEKPEDNELPIPDEDFDKNESEQIQRLEPGEESDSESQLKLEAETSESEQVKTGEETPAEDKGDVAVVKKEKPPKPKPKPKPKVETAMVVAIDKRGWGRRNIKHGVIADFGKGDKVVIMPKDVAMRMCSIHRNLFKILDPQTVGLLINPKSPKKPSEYTNPELMLELVNRYKTLGLFMKELRAMLLETDGNMYALSRCLSDNEMVECLNTTGQYVVLDKSVFEQANNEMANVQADNADMRSKLNLQPRPEPVK